jgi:hypothetical protein
VRTAVKPALIFSISREVPVTPHFSLTGETI